MCVNSVIGFVRSLILFVGEYIVKKQLSSELGCVCDAAELAVIIWAVEAQADGFDRLVKQVYKASGEPWDKPSYEFRDRGDRLVVYDADDHHVIGVACAFCGEQLARDQCYCECHDGPGCQMSKFRYPAPSKPGPRWDAGEGVVDLCAWMFP